MDALQEAGRILAAMTRVEKARLLQWIANDLAGDVFPGIEAAPGVCGGEPRIVRTRIPVWVLGTPVASARAKRTFSAVARLWARKT